jgi:hypothetical protein
MTDASWLSKPAVLWALDEAPDVPAHLVAALVAVARYADENGRGAHPSALTVAAHIRKTERNAKKDLSELRQLGLLLSGDQRIVVSIRADRRPFVYDLPMARGVAQDTPSRGHGVSRATARGVASFRLITSSRSSKSRCNSIRSSSEYLSRIFRASARRCCCTPMSSSVGLLMPPESGGIFGGLPPSRGVAIWPAFWPSSTASAMRRSARSLIADLHRPDSSAFQQAAFRKAAR